MTAHMERLSGYEDFDLGQLVNFIVMGRGDTVIELEAALGFSFQLRLLQKQKNPASCYGSGIF
jgi:phosphatidylserine decarboxylase